MTGSAVVAVSDRGPGIPDELCERVFEPYFRADASRNARSDGVGLGLAIARNMTLYNRAELVLMSRPGVGLTAELTVSRVFRG